MKSDLRYLLSTFDQRDRRLLGVYTLAQFLVATLDLVSVAAIFPLMQIVMGVPLESGSLGTIHRLLGSQIRTNFVLTLAALMVIAFIAKAVLAAALTWWSSGFVARLQTRTAHRLLTVYMTEDYLSHRKRNTGELMRTIGSSVQAAHMAVLGGILGLISSLMSIALVAILLLLVAPIPTIVAAIYFSVIVFAIQRLLAPANRRSGEAAQHASWLSSHALVDAMQGFREAVLHDAQPYFIDRFDRANWDTVQAARKANFLSVLPKYLLELVTMIGLVLLIVVELLSGSAQSAMPVLSLFVAATVKILPMMVSLTATIGAIRVGREGLTITVNALRHAQTVAALHSLPSQSSPPPSTDSTDGAIHLKNVTFRYPDGKRDIVHNISLTVPAGTSLALCGPSGSGKTTLVDIILGLLPPTAGDVSYAGMSTHAAGPVWHDVVAYVPQDVYITDDTLAGNVAFGLPPEEHNRALILGCLDRAQLGDLLDELPDGIDTLVGERGSRLSGGQRQRLGIARALYRQPQVLVLDEATSALDNETEHRITETMRSLRGSISTILVAHRLSSVRHVDQLAFLNNGDLEAVGTFEQVVHDSPSFARLVALGNLDSEPAADGDRPVTEEETR